MKKSKTVFDKIEELDARREEVLATRNKVLPLVILTPILLFTLIISLIPSGSLLFFAGIPLALLSFSVYYHKVLAPFEGLKADVKTILLKEFMGIYHPNIEYSYSPFKNRVKTIIERSELVSANKFHEEDVIRGKLGDVKFYLSEIKLEEQSGKSSTTKFKGMLFELIIPDKSFPPSKIQSSVGLLKRFFGTYQKNDKYRFWYDTQDQQKFRDELGPLFPFIRHLMQKQGDVRIHVRKRTIVILLSTDEKFLDKPSLELSRSFNSKRHYENIGKQINSFLFLMESFVNDLDTSEVEERLELKALEYAKLNKPDEKQ